MTVIRPISGWPFSIRRCCVPSVTKSAGPETATTPPVRRARSMAACVAASTLSPLSTPCPAPSRPASVRISEALPRMTVGRSATSRCETSVRSDVAPTPTGSRTQGLPATFIASAASSMDAAQAGSSVPMLTVSTRASAANSTTSSRAWTIAGEAPTARSTFAMTFMATKFVMLWTRGRSARMASRIVPGVCMRLSLGRGESDRKRTNAARGPVADFLRQHDLVQVRRVLLSPRTTRRRPCPRPGSISARARRSTRTVHRHRDSSRPEFLQFALREGWKRPPGALHGCRARVRSPAPNHPEASRNDHEA